MEDDRKQGERIFQTVCSMLNNRNWTYDRNDEELTIRCSVRSNDLPIYLKIWVEPERSVVRFLSRMFDVEESKRTEMAVAVSAANYAIVNGCFDFDIRDGELSFRLTMPYHECIIGEELFDDLLYIVCATVDEYNDKLFMLAKNMMSLSDFMDFVYNSDD